jgi:hypothetical protein
VPLCASAWLRRSDDPVRKLQRSRVANVQSTTNHDRHLDVGRRALPSAVTRVIGSGCHTEESIAESQPVDDWRFGVEAGTGLLGMNGPAGLFCREYVILPLPECCNGFLSSNLARSSRRRSRPWRKQESRTLSLHRAGYRLDRPRRRDRGSSRLADLKSGTPHFLTRGSRCFTWSITPAHSPWLLSADSQRPERRSCSPFDARDRASCSLSRTYSASCSPDIAEMSGAVSNSWPVATAVVAASWTSSLLSGLNSD